MSAGLAPGGRGFVIYLVAQAVSLLGDSFAFIAFPLLVLQTTGSVAQMGGVTAIASISMVVAGVIAGSIVDRTSPRTIIFGCDLFRAVTNLAVSLYWFASPHLWLLYAAVALGSAASALFQVSHTSLVPRLVERERLVAANGLYVATMAIAFMIGPVLAGGIAAAFGPTVAIGINGATFALAAAGVLFVRLRPTRQDQDQYMSITDGPFTGISYVWHHPILRWLLAQTAVTSIFTFGLFDLFIYYLRHDLGQSDARVGVMVGVAATGAIVAAITASPLRSRFGFAACWIGSCIVAGLATATLGITTYVPLLPIIGAALALGISLAVVCSTSLRQEITPEHVIGRATSVFSVVQLLAFGAGAATVTATAAWLGARPVFVAAGVALVCVGTLSIVAPWRSVRAVTERSNS
ncbi:MAG TPA: MFS transporter [Galbitalea sp.]|nr:MFS transporter [Galbitalea sp.]